MDEMKSAMTPTAPVSTMEDRMMPSVIRASRVRHARGIIEMVFAKKLFDDRDIYLFAPHSVLVFIVKKN